MCKKCGVDKCGCGPKKIITERGTAGKSALPALRGKPGIQGPPGDSSLTIKNTAFVSKNGNDSTALVERLDKTFLTIQAAINALVSAYPSRSVNDRKQVIVFAGDYSDDILLKELIDIHFYDVHVSGRIWDGNAVMTDVGAGKYTNIITGNLRLLKTANTNTGAFVLYKPTTRIYCEAHSIGAQYYDSLVVLNGTLKLKCDQIFTNDTLANYNLPIEMSQGFEDPDYTESIVEIIGADIFRGPSGIGPMISFSGGAASKNQKLILRDCRVKNTQSDEIAENNACIAVGNVSDSDGKITLYNTVLYSHAGNSINTKLGQTALIKCYHSNMSNVAHGGSGTNTFLLGSITVNAAVEAEF